MLPAATRTRLITDLPPSEELVRHNELKTHTFVPKTPRSHTKADLPPSDEYKKRNEVHAQPSRGPRKHVAGDMSPSSVLQQINERSVGWVHRDASCLKERTARLTDFYDKQLSSKDMKNCLVPPRNCAMSDAFGMANRDGRSSIAAGESVSTRLSSIPEDPRGNRNVRGSAASDVSSLSGILQPSAARDDRGTEAGRDDVSICSGSLAESMSAKAQHAPARHQLVAVRVAV